METTETKKRTRAELLQTIEDARLELEALNMWKKGQRVMVTGIVEEYADNLGTVVVKAEKSDAKWRLDEDCLESPAAPDAAIEDLANRCRALLGDNLNEGSYLAAIDAVVKLAEHSNGHLNAGNNGAGNESPSHLHDAASTQIYVVVRRESSKPVTRFDLSGREFFNGYLTMSDCEAYRKECEDRESSWGVRGGVYGIIRYKMFPAGE